MDYDTLATPLNDEAIDPDTVFEDLEKDRAAGLLRIDVAPGTVRYQGSTKYPGKLEEVHSDGMIRVGQVRNGQFTPDAEG